MNETALTAGTAIRQKSDAANRRLKTDSAAGGSIVPVSGKRSHSVEERLNSLTHAVGAGLSIAGVVYLLISASSAGRGALALVSFAIYGATQILLYLSSTFMHQFTDIPTWYRPLHMLDQAAIYLLIAGTYTPVALLGLGGALGWTIFGVIWALAIGGILMKTLLFKGRHVASDLLYLPMGWLLLVVLKPLIAAMPAGFFIWVIIGAASYTLGILFYIFDRFPFCHVIWHLFVISGSMGFFIGIFKYLVQ